MLGGGGAELQSEERRWRRRTGAVLGGAELQSEERRRGAAAEVEAAEGGSKWRKMEIEGRCLYGGSLWHQVIKSPGT